MAISMAEIEAKVTADTAAFDSAMDASGQKVTDLGAKGTAAGANFGAASAVMAAGAVGIGAAIADSVMAAGDFQASMNEIGAVTGATAGQMTQLSDTALQVGMDTSFSAQQGAEAISELGKAGIPIPDIINGAAMATANLAAAGGVDMPRAAEVMSNAMNTFSLSGDQAAATADTLAAAANASSSDVNSLAMGLSQVGPSAQGLGLSLEETVAQLALFSNYGMQGSDAGTSFKTMIASLTPATKKAHEAFQDLGLETADVANAFFDAQGNFVGMEKATDLLYDALAPLTDEQRLMAEETIFGSDASRAAEITFQAQKAAVNGTADGYGKLLNKVKPAGQATAVANAKMAGMNGALEALKGSIETAQIAFGTAFLPVIEQVADGLTALVNAFLGLDPQVQTTISFIAAGAAAFLAVGAAIGFIVGPLGAAAAALAPVAAGFLLIAAPLAATVAGLALLKRAYDQNLGGFADAVNEAASQVTAAFEPVLRIFDKVVRAFQRGGIDEAIDVLASKLPRLQNAFGNVASTLGDLAGQAIPAIVAAFRSVDWQAVGDAIGDGIQGALGALSNFGAWVLNALTGGGGGGGGAGNLAAELGGWVAARFSEIDWPQLGTALLDGAKRAVALFLDFSQWGFDRLEEIGTWLMAVVDQIDWPIVGTALLNGAKTAAALLLDFSQWGLEALATFGQWLSDQIAPGLQTLSTSILTAIQEVADGFGPIGTAMVNVLSGAWMLIQAAAVAAIATLAQTINSAWTGIQGGVAAAWSAIQATISAAWTAIQTAAVTAIAALAGMLASAWAGIQSGASTAWTGLQTTIETGWTAVQTGAVAAIASLAALMSNAWTGLQSGAKVAWSAIQETISTAATASQTAVNDAWIAIQNAVSTATSGIRTGLTSEWEIIQTFMGEKQTAIQTAVSDAWIAIQNAVSLPTSAIRTGLTSEWEIIQTFMGEKQTAIQMAVSTAWSAMQDAISTALGSIQSGISTAFGAIVTTITTQADAAKTGLITSLGNMVTEAGTKAGEVKAAITDAFVNAGTWLFDAGQQTIQGFIDGIGSMKDAVTSAITDATNGLIQGAHDKLEAHSPSRVFYRLGQNINEGFINGIDDGSSSVRSAAQDFVGVAVDAAGQRISAQSGGASVNGLGHAFVQEMAAGLSLNSGVLNAATGMVHEAVVGAQDQINRESVFELGQGFGQDFINGIFDKLDAAKDVGRQLADAAGSALGGVGRAVGASDTGSAPARARGGPVSSGLSYWVGERGPELFTPSRSGSIVPNGAAMGMAAGGNSSIVIQNLNLPSVRDAEGFIEAMQSLMQSNGVATGRGVS